MDDTCGFGRNLAKGIDMAHYVMAHFFLPRTSHFIVDVVLIGLHLIDLFLGNIQAERFLGLSQGDPQPAPGRKLHVWRKDIQHFLGGVAGRKWTFINSAQC